VKTAFFSQFSMPRKESLMNVQQLTDAARQNRDILVILLIGAIVRVWAMGSVPGGLQQDEASAAYDAYALLHYGIDRNGFHLPLVLVGWGSSMDALPAYLAMPFMAVFGGNRFAARLPSLLLGIASIVVLYKLIRITIDKPTAQIAALLMAISPGHIMLSRWAHDACYFPGFFLIGVLLLALSFRRKRLLYASALLFGLSLYTYPTAYLVVPLFLVLISVYGAVHRLWPWKQFLLTGLMLFVLALPIAAFMVINAKHLPSIVTPFFSIPRLPTPPRYGVISNLPFINPSFLRTSWQNLQEGFRLLESQNDGLIWNVMPEFGVLYLFSLPLILLGFALLVERTWKREAQPAFVLLAWCVTTVLVAAFNSLNINRANIAFIPMIFCAAIGLKFFRRKGIVFWPLLALFLISFVRFTHSYFSEYRNRSAFAFAPSLDLALQDAARNTAGPICVTGNLNMPYIFALFYNHEDPHVFVNTVQYSDPGAMFQHVSSFGRYRFGLDLCNDRLYGAYVLTRDERGRFDSPIFRITDFQYYSVAYPRSGIAK
jgi:4-amino-4-deoxy-L-arabinose transferase-like glycosyltransferase